MADVYPQPEDDERPIDLEADNAPDPVVVFDRPEQAAGGGVNLALILILLALLVIGYFVLTTLF